MQPRRIFRFNAKVQPRIARRSKSQVYSFSLAHFLRSESADRIAVGGKKSRVSQINERLRCIDVKRNEKVEEQAEKVERGDEGSSLMTCGL